MNKTKILVLLIISNQLICSCYRMDYKEDLNIIVTQQNIKSSSLKFFIDSIYKMKPIPDSIIDKFVGDNKLRKDERIIFLKRSKKYLLIGLDVTPCYIKEIYDERISPYAIYSKKELTNDQLINITNSFNNELLREAKEYSNSFQK